MKKVAIAAKEEDMRADGQAHATKACKRHNKTATCVSGQAEESTADLTRYRLVYTCD